VPFYTSTLPRAIETGAIVLPAIGAKLSAVTDESLEELGVGEADGLDLGGDRPSATKRRIGTWIPTR